MSSISIPAPQYDYKLEDLQWVPAFMEEVKD
jgi:hypothetical protein